MHSDNSIANGMRITRAVKAHGLTRVTWLDMCRDTDSTRRNFVKKSTLDERR